MSFNAKKTFRSYQKCITRHTMIKKTDRTALERAGVCVGAKRKRQSEGNLYDLGEARRGHLLGVFFCVLLMVAVNAAFVTKHNRTRKHRYSILKGLFSFHNGTDYFGTHVCPLLTSSGGTLICVKTFTKQENLNDRVNYTVTAIHTQSQTQIHRQRFTC